jgi:ABC-type transporter Mla subunit MlaD
MSGRLRGLGGPFVKLGAFALVTVLASYVLLSTITNAGYGEQATYRAQFTDVAGLVEGDEVRIAGVRVGQVTGIGLGDQKENRSPR